ncbi:MAG: SCO family protein [Bacteroidales bacterium]|nr:SCO family protein [Bacteroidales bacterium]
MKQILYRSLTILMIFMHGQGVFAQETDSVPELGIYEHLDAILPDDLVFTDENYNEVNLKQAIDKPTILALVYYECPGICSPLLEGVAEVIDRASMELGKEYQVFTVSFDHTEPARLAAEKKKNYARLVKGQDVQDHWRFFTGDSIMIDRLMNTVGFRVLPDGEEFIHPAAIIVISPQGKITRYLYGIYFLPFDLKMAVVEASEGRSGPTINKVLKYCFSYDPEGKKYVINITKVSGTLIIVLALALFAGLAISSRRKRSKPQNPS